MNSRIPRLTRLEEHTSQLCRWFGTAAESLGTGANPSEPRKPKLRTQLKLLPTWNSIGVWL